MSARSKARRRALDILFEAELRGHDPLITLAERTLVGEPPVREYTTVLVQGVHAHGQAIDSRIAMAAAQGWSLQRMPRVDRTAVRIAVLEIDYLDVPDGVAVSEAVALVADLSTDDSPAYVNGILGKIISTKVA